ncbi:MAG: hypothetical protein K2G93_01580 [Rikenella sp.]|nr:hypothetical protein [Rikenella sp.]
MYNVGNNGFSWASSFTGTNTYRLNFNSGAVNPNDNGNRANGFQLRCLQAFIADTPCFRKNNRLTPNRSGGAGNEEELIRRLRNVF